MEEAGNHSVDKLAQEEHEVLLGLLNLRAKSAATSVSTKNGG
jgi:ribosomal protein L29